MDLLNGVNNMKDIDIDISSLSGYPVYNKTLDLNYSVEEIKDKILNKYLTDSRYCNMTATGICDRLLNDALYFDDKVINKDPNSIYCSPKYSGIIERKVNKALMDLLVEGKIIYMFDYGYFELWENK